MNNFERRKLKAKPVFKRKYTPEQVRAKRLAKLKKYRERKALLIAVRRKQLRCGVTENKGRAL